MWRDSCRPTPRSDAVYGHRVLIDERGWRSAARSFRGTATGFSPWADFIPQETLFWRRAVWERAGATMDESFRYALDWDLLVRLREPAREWFAYLGSWVRSESTALRRPALWRRRRESRRCSESANGCTGARWIRKEVLRRVRPYLTRHVVLDQLYRRGLLRY